MNICCLNVSSKMCFRLHYAQSATATLEPYHRSHRLGSSFSPRIVAERKNHLAIAPKYTTYYKIKFKLNFNILKSLKILGHVQIYWTNLVESQAEKIWL